MAHPRIAVLGILAMGIESTALLILAAVLSAIGIILAITLDLIYLHAYQKFCNYYCCCPFQRLTDEDAISIDV
ncbi:protein O7 [Cercopithecine betaherpesvirus 5]|uniref:Protein O7 n=1 Tax=Simian cytomegalovirus (strain Colburn) TaxID=50292 RepID=G8XTQ5_SCMVC|nr:protein O7 [Cercopithecine betaherpesvirus 5]